MKQQPTLNLSLGKSLTLLMCMFVICYLLTAVLSFVLGKALATRPVEAMRISTIAQDLIVFIVPAVGTSLLACRRPAELLGLMSRPRPLMLVAVAVMLFVSVPLQDAIIYWNYHVSLPECMSGFENACRRMEEMASGVVGAMMADTSIPSLILNILIIGVAAGFSEELLFRGCMQRLLTTSGVNHHLSIWIVAFLFSAMHLQIFGFVPRMLLGAYFGYLLWWTKSIWVPMMAHVLNNTIYVVVMWWQIRRYGVGMATDEPTLPGLLPAVGSLLLTVALLTLMYKLSKQK